MLKCTGASTDFLWYCLSPETCLLIPVLHPHVNQLLIYKINPFLKAF